MAYSVCHATLKLSMKCYMKFLSEKFLFFQTYNSYSNNLILCCKLFGLRDGLLLIRKSNQQTYVTRFIAERKQDRYSTATSLKRWNNRSLTVELWWVQVNNQACSLSHNIHVGSDSFMKNN